MRVLNYNAGSNYKDYIVKKGKEMLADIDKLMGSITTKEEWLLLRKKLEKAYKAAYPSYIFEDRKPVVSKFVSEYKFKNYKIENHIFESYPGWYVNATVYLPLKKGKYPGIVCPTGHSSKKFPNYTGSAQLFARSGYIAVSFDPPGMQGEHHPGDEDGNNHFEDGVRSYLSGFWSQTFFIYDAIRCIDYLESRNDVIKDCGFAMTGISGGGTTTFHTNILEERLSCIAPVCCISDEVGLTLDDRYTFCCEGKGFDHWANGIKFSTMLALSAPVPLLLCSGAKDAIFDYKLAIDTIEKTKKIYKLYNSFDADIFVDKDSGHQYSVQMVNKVVTFFDKHLKGIVREEAYYNYSENDLEHPEPEQVRCGIKDTASMYTANLKAFENKKRKILSPDDLAKYLKIDKNILPMKIKNIFKSDLIWVHTLSGIGYKINESIEVPALLLERESKPSDTIIVYTDDNNKWDNIKNDGYLAQKAGFLNREIQVGECSVISMEITGIGELKLEPGFYDMAGWSSSERLFSYLAIVMGSSITAQQTMEILAILNSLKKQGKYKLIKCVAKGKTSIPMLYASYIFGEYSEIVLENLPVSYKSMAEYVPNDFMPMSVLFNTPENLEIYEIVNETDNITLINPIKADKTVITSRQAQSYYKSNVNLIFDGDGIKKEYL